MAPHRRWTSCCLSCIAKRFAASCVGFGLLVASATAQQLTDRATASALAAPGARAKSETTRIQLLPIAVRVNGAASGDWLLLRVDGKLHASMPAVQSWRLRGAATAPTLNYQNQTWVDLASFAGYTAHMDDDAQQLTLAFDPQAFEASQLANDRLAAPVTATREHALFLNYDTTFTVIRQRAQSQYSNLGVITELGWTGPLGFLTSSHAIQHSDSGGTSVRRLETSFTHDQPGDYLSWRLGDSSTRASLWSPPTYFGGLQVGRNFRLNPAFISQPVPVLAGSANAPSTLELYLNNVLQQSTQVPAGPFSVDSTSGLTRGGQARLVLRDALGRETVVVRDFFNDANLLEEGLSDWSVEAGAIRESLGGNGAGYGRLFGAGLWRQGLSKTMTVEARVEADRERQAAGGGLLAALDGYWMVRAALAGSQTPGGSGSRWTLQLDADPLRQRLAARVQGTSRGFRQLGDGELTLPSRQETSLALALLADGTQSLRLFTGRLAPHVGTSATTLGLAYSRSLADGAYFSASVTQARMAGRNGVSAVATWTIPWGAGVQVAAIANRRDGSTEPALIANRNPSSPDEIGWRAASGRRGDATYAEAGIYQQARHAWLSADISSSSQQQALRTSARGGLVWIDGSLFPSRRLDESFGLVEVPGHANVGIGYQGQSLVHTDARGRALIPTLQPFNDNRIQLNANDLPVTAELDSVERSITPGRRSAVRVVFAVHAGQSALLRVLLSDGQPAPLGALVRLQGNDEEFIVARNGDVFVTGLKPAGNLVSVHWGGASCTFDVAMPQGEDAQVRRIGPLTCQGVPR